ncbi:MAG: universal stress protein [Bacteroidia bacterium]
MNTIFVATDFSKAAENATQYAIAAARETNADLILFHADAKYGKILNKKAREIELKACQSKVNDRCREISEKYKLNCRGIVGIRPGSKEIINEALKNKARFIFMGITEASRLKKGILGSMTMGLIKSAKIPVLAIPEKAKFSSFSKLVLAIGATVPDFNVLKKLANFASGFNAEIHVVHVLNDKKKSLVSLSETKGLIEKTGYENITYNTLTGKNIAKELDNYIEKEKASVLIIVRKNISFLHDLLSGLAGKMTFISHVPLLVFNEEIYSIGPLGIKAEELLG